MEAKTIRYVPEGSGRNCRDWMAASLDAERPVLELFTTPYLPGPTARWRSCWWRLMARRGDCKDTGDVASM
jgi:hypothetical protein